MSTGRALYLDASIGWRVGLDDDTALSVVAPGRARSLYPLGKLSRVVSPAHADWALPALLACLRAGVPVLFHDARGEPVGWCFGPRRRETTLAELLRLGLAQPEWEARFGAWRRATEHRQQRLALAATGASEPGCTAPSSVRAHLCNRHRQRLGLPPGPPLRALRRGAAALVAQHLQHELGDTSLIGWARPGFHLGLVLTDLLEWGLHGVLWQTSAAEVRTLPTGRLAAQALERHGAAMHRTLGELLGSLERFLREWLW